MNLLFIEVEHQAGWTMLVNVGEIATVTKADVPPCRIVLRNGADIACNTSYEDVREMLAQRIFIGGYHIR